MNTTENTSVPTLKNVICFNSWANGASLRLIAPELQRIGYQLLLVHIGSWGHQKGRPLEEREGDLLIRDIAYYKGLSFKEILLKEDPSVVMFLSTRAFAHQAFNRYSLSLGIPTLHIYHGLVSVQAINDGSSTVYKINWIKRFGTTLNRAYKNMFIIWPVFFVSLLSTNAPLQNWMSFVKEIYSKIARPNVGAAPPDATTTAGCVYTNADIQHMIDTYRVADEHVHAVGNPDLVRFGVEREDIGLGLKTVDESAKTILYIDTSLVRNDIIFHSMKEYIEHLVDTRDELRSQGYELLMKLHPAQLETTLPDQLRAIGIEVCDQKNFIDRLRNAAGAIAEPSSAAIIPALLGIPLFLAKYGKLEKLRYGKVLTSYPRAHYLFKLNEFHEVLQQDRSSLNVTSTKAWIKENAGPLPASEMPNRVATVIDALASKSKK